jgi:hypothetical protein
MDIEFRVNSKKVAAKNVGKEWAKAAEAELEKQFKKVEGPIRRDIIRLAAHGVNMRKAPVPLRSPAKEHSQSEKDITTENPKQ